MPARAISPTSLPAIASRLKALREASGLKQAAWCRLIGIDTNAWNNYERGIRRISLDQALLVCTTTGATLEYIYRGMGGGLPMELAIKLQRR
jgi:transcriptional regulator with XRE-family HTH domain